ncbi:MAG TPA: hypothetical protein VG408_04370 [Actinomycetota bacterium]|nr:hypothetical protein [Actinomycetota bacterium]
MNKRLLAVLASAALVGAVAVPSTPALANHSGTYQIQVGQEFFDQGVPGFSARIYPGSVRVHKGDTIVFAPGFLGMAPEGAYPQELMGETDAQIGAPGSFFLFDPDEAPDALKFNLDVFFDQGDACGAADNPCVWGSNSEVIFPAFDENRPEVNVRIDAEPGTTLWAAAAAGPDVNVNFKVEVVGNNETTSTQDELDARAADLIRKDYEDALALHARMNSKRTSHVNQAGDRVFDVFVGAAGGPIELFASYPRRISVPRGSRVQFHFMSQIEPHTATFGGERAREVFQNFLVPACDPDGDEGTMPDVEPTGFDEETETPICPEGTTLEGDVHPLLPWEVGDGRVTSNSDYENSGLIFPRFPDGSEWDRNPNPWTERFPNASGRKGFKYICLVHGGFMGGHVRVTR